MRKLRKPIRIRTYAVKIAAPHDVNGNPRRAWLLYDREGKYLGAVDEGYSGYGALKTVAPNHIELAHIKVPPLEYRAVKKDFIYY